MGLTLRSVVSPPQLERVDRPPRRGSRSSHAASMPTPSTPEPSMRLCAGACLARLPPVGMVARTAAQPCPYASCECRCTRARSRPRVRMLVRRCRVQAVRWNPRWSGLPIPRVVWIISYLCCGSVRNCGLVALSVRLLAASTFAAAQPDSLNEHYVPRQH
jgi:hypothetical protein